MDDALNTGSWQPNTFMDIVSPRVKNSLQRNTLKSNTLMRSAVKKPEQAQVEQQQVAQSIERPDLSQSAQVTDRSPLISRYSANQYGQAAETQQANFQTDYPSMDGPSEAPIEGPAAIVQDAEPIAIAAEQPSINIFKNAAANGFEYSQPAVKTKSKRGLKKLSGWTVLAVVGVGLVAGGLFINSNLSKFELYLASSRAGFSATLPGVKPSGFSLGGISTGSGVIEASFKGNTGNRAYTISEKKSAVSSTELMNNYVQSQAGLNFQTIKTTTGNTVYVYGSHNATWVNGGVWYIVQDNNSLSDHQITDIASSM